MRLNIETTKIAGTQKVLQQVFTNEEVRVIATHDTTVDFEIRPQGADERCEYVYPAESILELAAVIPPHKVRIY